MLLRGVAQIVEDRARFDPPELLRRVDFQDAVQIFDMSIMIDTLQHCPQRLMPQPRPVMGDAVFVRHRGGDDVGGGFGEHDADLGLAIIRAVGRVERAAPVVEADFAADLRAQFLGQGGALRTR